MMQPRDVLEHYVKRHNAGVRSGDFAPLLEMFADDARLELVDRAIGPFVGKAAIARAFASHPPDDALELLSVSQPDLQTGEATYRWLSGSAEPAGAIRLELASMRIVRLVITGR